MKQPNENGVTQYYKVTPIDRLRYRIKAIILHIKNWDAERWYRKYGGS